MSDVVHARLDDVTWRAFAGDGKAFALLRNHEAGGIVAFTRFERGVHGGRHSHPGGEDLFVIRGRCRVDDVRLSAGDYLYTPPGASHELVAEEETVVLAILPLAPVYDAHQPIDRKGTP
jgi:quercetin dioxygenase-like cupin family protein